MENAGASPISAPAIDVVIFAAARDAQLTRELLARDGFPCTSCASADELLRKITPAIGAVILAQEVLTPSLLSHLSTMLGAQPAWSDLPVILVTSEAADAPPLQALAPLGNLSLLRRPMDTMSLLSTVAAALRARRRQFEVRDLLRQQRDESDRKDQFLAMLAHELRNPLTPIRYASHLLQTGATSQERQAQLADMVDRQVGHMGRIIDQLLDVSRLTRGLIRLQRTPVSLSAIVQESVEVHATAARARRIELRLDLRAEGVVDGDATRLRQVVDNLVDNAIKFSPEDGLVSLVVDSTDASVILSVQDRGDGIDEDLQPMLFEAFVQADRSLARSPGGLGLGLALVKGIVAMHEGRVWATSDGRGKGSTFTIELPSSGGASTTHVAIQASTSRSDREVLIAEDNIDAADALRMILEGNGYRVHVVHNGHAAVEALASMRPDALVCDIGLPGLSGYDVARAADRTFRPRAMVAVTGYASARDKEDALAAGFDVHLPKPVAIRTLLDALDSLLEQPGRAAAELRLGTEASNPLS